MIEDFLAAGGNAIDTANGNAAGRSESMLADLLRGRREQVVLASKVGIPHPTPRAPPHCRSTGSADASRPACAAWTPTTSTCCTSTNPTASLRSAKP